MVHRMLASQNGHFYVCGDCRMAEDVADTLRVVFQKAGGLSLKDSDALLTKLRVILIIYPFFYSIIFQLGFTERKALPRRHFRHHLPSSRRYQQSDEDIFNRKRILNNLFWKIMLDLKSPLQRSLFILFFFSLYHLWLQILILHVTIYPF